MNIFVFEDSFFRNEWFRNRYSGENVICTDELDLAVKYLNETLFDMIFLDHDLGDEKPYTGMTIAKMIHRTQNRNSAIVVHSMNAPASDRMYDEMVGNGCGNVKKIMYSEFAGG